MNHPPHLVVAASWPALWRAGWLAVHPPATLEPAEAERLTRRERGLCIWCGKKAVKKQARCVRCARIHRERTK